MKIVLPIDEGYCEHWEVPDALREFFQNGADADEFNGAKLSVEHYPRTNKLIIENADITVEARLLLMLGASSKRGTDQRGKYGVGFIDALTTLTRLGHPVTIYNGDEVWRPSFETPDEGHPFQGSKMLVITTRKLRETRTAFTVEVEGISKDVWSVLKKRFLFITPPPMDSVVGVYGGKVLLGEDYRGLVFSRGVYVTTVDDLECGYDIDDLKLDRDRRSIEDWDLRWRLSEILNKAHRDQPDKFRKRVYDMAKEGKKDVKSLTYHADALLLKALREEFQAENGADAVPVKDMTESRELEALGARTVVVSQSLQELLEKTGPKIEDVKNKLKAEIKKRYAWADLSKEEQVACLNWVEKVSPTYVVVDFNNAETACQILTEDDGTTLSVSKELLSKPLRELVAAIVPQEAARRCINAQEIYLNLLFPA